MAVSTQLHVLSLSSKHADHVRTHGIIQFLHIYHKLKDRKDDCLRFGDEVEFTLLQVDEEAKKTQLCLRAKEVIDVLSKPEIESKTDPTVPVYALWRPEYAEYMIEGTPGAPYSSKSSDFLDIEKNMTLRRKLVQELLKPGERVLSLTAFPLLGVGNYAYPETGPTHGEFANSEFVSDNVINSHPRFGTLTRNIRERRGSKVAINIPLFQDTNTKNPPELPGSLPGHIYMDAMAFGMGLSCLQCTFQAASIDEARLLYDHLQPLAPIMLALTAATPIQRGYISDTDVRWNNIVNAVDDRTPEERGEAPLKGKYRRINKSRYASIDCYISNDPALRPDFHNDIPLVFDESIYQRLRQGGVDHMLSRHLAHLFIRDPLVIYNETLNVDDTKATDHFENIQSTNWQTVRFKPPPPGSDKIGWRVEFRPCDLQMTDFENAAVVVFVVLLSRVMLSHSLNMLMPLSKVDVNMERAHRRDAISTQKFWFRRHVGRPTLDAEHVIPDYDVVEEMTLNEIINGKTGFPGLIPLVHDHLDNAHFPVAIRLRVNKYLELLSARANGSLHTNAKWMRNFVRTHPEYRHDSVVNERMTHDLLDAMHKIQQGEMQVPEMLGDLV